jgi:ABC-2 type transport system permease protein
MSRFITLCRHGLFTAFTAPSTYALIIFYLIASAVLTLTLGSFIDSNRADLNGFFIWQCWLFLLLGASLGMGQWAEEYHRGTAELLLTLPVATSEIVCAKFFSSWAVLTCALVLTFPLPLTCIWLGNPDIGAMLTGYLGAWLVAGLFLALAQAISCCTRSQFASFLTTILLGIVTLLAGFTPANILMTKWGVSTQFLDGVASLSVLRHFECFTNGAPSVGDFFYFIAPMLALVLFTQWRIRKRHRPTPRRQALLCWAEIAILIFITISAPKLMPWRLDCTAEKCYTIDAGSREILAHLSKPVNITLFYSASEPELTAQQRQLAAHLRQLLAALQRAYPHAITLNELDPREESDQANAEAQGLTPHITTMGELWFLGATITTDSTDLAPQCIADFTTIGEDGAEYAILKAITASQRQNKRTIGIISTLPVTEHVVEKELKPAWQSIQALEEDFALLNIGCEATALPTPAPDLLLIIHPTNLNDALSAAIKNYLADGGKAIICLDPLSKADAQLAGQYRLPRPSALPQITASWGVNLKKNYVIADRTLATAMTDPRRGLEQLPTLLSVSQDGLSKQSPITAWLNKITLFCAGELEITPTNGYIVTPLIQSTVDSRLLRLYEAQRSAIDILNNFKPDEKRYTLAALVEGADAHAVVISDVDFLHNSLCVNTTDEQDSEVARAISDNAVFLSNCANYLCGESQLLKLRSRGHIRRSFKRLESLGHATEMKIQLLSAEELRAGQSRREQLHLLERRLTTLNDSEKARLTQLRQEESAATAKLKIAQRAELKTLRASLDHIECGIALTNAAALPALLAVIALCVAYRRRK